MESNELTRLIRNLVRKGVIMAIDHSAATCRVSSGDLQTNWIRWMAVAAGETRDWNPPTVGEQVLLICPGGDPADALALRGIYSDDAPAPSNAAAKHVRIYPDGAVIEYDHAAHALTATLPAGGSVAITAPSGVTVTTETATVVATSVTLDAADTTCTGNLTVQGMLTSQGMITGQGGMAISSSAGGAAAVITGGLTATEDIVAGTISLKGHRHPSGTPLVGLPQ